MKNSKAFYRSALATAIVMALSAPAFAADNAVSTTPVTLDKDKTTLDQDVVISNTADQQITAVTINAADKELLAVMILLLNQRQTKNSLKV